MTQCNHITNQNYIVLFHLQKKDPKQKPIIISVQNDVYIISRNMKVEVPAHVMAVIKERMDSGDLKLIEQYQHTILSRC